MLVRVQFTVICSSEADAVSLQSTLTQRIASKAARFVVHQPVNVIVALSTWLVTGDVSFSVRADADDIYQTVQDQWISGPMRNRLLAGSTTTLHICTHADGEPPPWGNCRGIELLTASKV